MLLHAGPEAFITNEIICWLRWLGAVLSVPTVQLITDLRVVTTCLAR